MKQKTVLVLYIILAFLMLIDFYLIFNVGNPKSLLRPLIPSCDYDLAVTLGVSAAIAFFSFFVFRNKKENPIVQMLRENRNHIQDLRREGKSDEEITDSFLEELEKIGKVRKTTRQTVLSVIKEME